MIFSLLRRLTLAASLLLLSGCVAHLNSYLSPPPGYNFSPPHQANPIFDYIPRGPVHLSKPIDRTRLDTIRKLSYLSSGHNGATDDKVHAIYFQSRKDGRKSLLIVLPIWGTSEYPPSHIARGYARHSHGHANVVWILGNTPIFPWQALRATQSSAEFVRMAKDSAERYRSAVVDIRRLIDWAETQPDIDPTRIGIVGFSMSALVTATLLGNDDRLAGAVLMMAGANYADIFSYCGDRAGEVRNHVLSQFGWSTKRYHDFFAKLFKPADPIQYKGRYDPTRILMIDGAFDDCMPRSSRDALWEVTGHPQRITLLSKHRSGFYSLTPLGLNFIRRKIYRFLDLTLDPTP